MAEGDEPDNRPSGRLGPFATAVAAGVVATFLSDLLRQLQIDGETADVVFALFVYSLVAIPVAWLFDTFLWPLTSKLTGRSRNWARAWLILIGIAAAGSLWLVPGWAFRTFF